MNWKDKTRLDKVALRGFWILLALCGVGAILGSVVLLVVHHYRTNGPVFQVATNQVHTNSGTQAKPVGLWYSFDEKNLLFYDLNKDTTNTVYSAPKDYKICPVNDYQLRGGTKSGADAVLPLLLCYNSQSFGDKLVLMSEDGAIQHEFTLPVNSESYRVAFNSDLSKVAWCQNGDLIIYQKDQTKQQAIPNTLPCEIGSGGFRFAESAEVLYFSYGLYEYYAGTDMTPEEYAADYRRTAKKYGVGVYALDLTSQKYKLVHPSIELDESDGVIFADETVSGSELVIKTDIKNPKLVNFYNFPKGKVFVSKTDLFKTEPVKSIVFQYPTDKVTQVVLSADGQFAYSSPVKLSVDKTSATCAPNIYRTDITANPATSELAYESPKCADVLVASGKKFLIREEDSLFAVGADRVPKPVVLRQRYQIFGTW
jgi:hypothetical protein